MIDLSYINKINSFDNRYIFVIIINKKLKKAEN